VRILLLDIETAPNRVYTWGMFDQNIGHNQVEESGYVLCWAAKWFGRPNKDIKFESVRGGEDPKPMLAAAHKLLDKADVVIHYNGLKFDIPTLNKEFIKHGMLPPSPYKQLDLLQVIRRVFRFERNTLDYVSEALEIGRKVAHEGFTLWVKCMRNDPKAWAKMKRYNIGDVKQLEKLYRRLRPWISRHPNLAAGAGDRPACPKCGSVKVVQQGTRVAVSRTYRRYQCQSCGGWFRGTKVVSRQTTGGVNIAD